MPTDYEGGTLNGKIYAKINGEYVEVSDFPEPLTLTEAVERMEEIGFVRERHGEWVDSDPGKPDARLDKDGMSYYCSVCGHRAGKYKHKTYRFCPWCGAKMNAEELRKYKEML